MITSISPTSPFELASPETFLSIGITLVIVSIVVFITAVLEHQIKINERAAILIGVIVLLFNHQFIQNRPEMIHYYAVIGLAFAVLLPVVVMISLARGLLKP